MQPWMIVYLALAAVALVQAVLVTLQAWEHRRFARGRCRKHKPQAPKGRVALIAPCKGLDQGLEDNLRPLFEQDHPNYELVLAVESERDLACEVIRKLLSQYPHVSARLVVAGVATRSGQKVHNLLSATAGLAPEIELLAFVDSDARPRREWLRWLIEHLGDQGVAAATAYRWFIPARPTLANHLLYSLNCGVATMVGPGKRSMVWGGSWAIRRDAFDRIRLREAWHGTLSDDLVAARVLGEANCRVEFEPACMAASPLDVDWSSMMEFVRRQYTIGRCYSPRWWAGALAFVSFAQVMFWGSVALAVTTAVVGITGSWIPASVAGMLYLVGSLRAWVRQDASRTYLPQFQDKLRSARRFDLWLHPLSACVNWLGLLQSCRGRRIIWRGIGYEIGRGGQIRILDAKPTSRPATLPLPYDAEPRRRAG